MLLTACWCEMLLPTALFGFCLFYLLGGSLVVLHLATTVYKVNLVCKRNRSRKSDKYVRVRVLMTG